MTTIALHLPKLHEAQRQIVRESKRMNAISCGRRFGKTFLLQDMAIRPALEGYPVGWFAPTFGLLLESWRDLSRVLHPIMKRTNANEHRMELITGGMLDFWTLDNPDAGRSRKYKRVIIDEAGLDRRASCRERV